MNAYTFAIFPFFLYAVIVHAADTYPAFCHEDYANDQLIEIICSGKQLDDNNYMDTLNASFYQMETVARTNVSMDDRDVAFYVENNRIETLEILPPMAKVITLSFRNNHLVSGEDGTFQHFPHLKNLDLSHNKFAGENLTKNLFRGEGDQSSPLEHLSLAHNPISELQHDLFTYLTNLTSLDLDNTRLKTITPETAAAIWRIPKLQSLILGHTQLSHIPDVFFTKLSLQRLFLNGNYFTKVPDSLRHLGKTLEFLNLSENPICELDADSFVGLSNLRELHINAMAALTTIRENAFAPLTSLIVLHCTFNLRLKLIHPKAFHKPKGWTLQEIYLDHNNLGSLAKETFELEKLSFLSLGENPWNCTCVLKWLFQFVKDRQVIDPEANFGMKCKYPDSLLRRSMVVADRILRCNVTEEMHGSADEGDHSAAIVNGLTRTIAVSILIAILFAVMVAFCRNAASIRAGSVLGSPFSSTTAKYERAELNDNHVDCASIVRHDNR